MVKTRRALNGYGGYIFKVLDRPIGFFWVEVCGRDACLLNLKSFKTSPPAFLAYRTQIPRRLTPRRNKILEHTAESRYQHCWY